MNIKPHIKLHIKLLGNPIVILEGEPVTGFRSLKAQALFYYLVATRRPHTRAALAGLFWGDVAEQHARRSLTSVLSNLRRLLGDYLHVTRESIALHADAAYELDLESFQQQFERKQIERKQFETQQIERKQFDWLQQAVALYQGDFLEGFFVPDAPEFEQWVLVERTRLREMLLQTLATLAALQAEQSDLHGAIKSTRRLLSIEPWREEAHRQLMLWLAQNGQRAAALAQYEQCRRILSAELEVAPDAETAALLKQIRAGEIEKVATLQPVERSVLAPPNARPADSVESRIGQDRAQAAIRNNLTAQSTPFIGRHQDLADLQSRLRDPQCRLVTLVGPGGIGKTRLALAAAEQHLPHMADGVYFVSLQSVGSPTAIFSAIANAIGFRFYTDAPPQDQLIGYLHQKQMLLVLDNFEHLLEGAGRIAQLMANAPHLKIITTSREALRIQEEWFHPISGLRFPHDEEFTPKSPELFDAIALFAQNARRSAVHFSLEAEWPHVTRICRLVDGMPLGIELAAAWLKVIPCKQIANEIARNLDILTTRQQNLPERHRSIRVVLEQSWHMLDDDEQDVLSQLSVFRGGFGRDAAMQVANASPPILSTLLEKSFLRWENERYHIHELLRQFAEEQLQSIGADGQILEAHSRYYLSLVVEQGAALRGPTPALTAQMLHLELDNLRQAWRLAVLQKKIDQLQSVFETLAYFYEYTGLLAEGQQIFIAAADALEHTRGNDRPGKVKSLICHCLIKSIYFWHHLERSGEFENQDERVRKLLIESNNALCKAEYTTIFGLSEILAGHPEQAIPHLQNALPLCEEHGEWHHLVFCLQIFGESLGRMKRGNEAQLLLQRALQITIANDDVRGRAITLSHMGVSAFYGEEYAQAHVNFVDAVALFEEIGDIWRAGRTANNDGFVLFHLEQYEEALQTAQRALEWQEKIAVSGEISIVYDTLGQIYYAMGRYSEARAHHQQALAESRHHKRPHHEAEALTYLAGIDVAEGNLLEAQAQLNQIFTLLDTEPVPQLLAKALEVQGTLHASSGEHELAIQRYDAALAQYQAAEQRYEQTHLLLSIGKVYLTLARVEDAQTALHKSLALAREIGRQSIIESASNLLAES